jgi:hypothetical protein
MHAIVVDNTELTEVMALSAGFLPSEILCSGQQSNMYVLANMSRALIQ